MNIWEVAEACLKLGMPMAALSWFMFSWLHAQGKVDIAADGKTIKAELKQVKKSHKSEKSKQAKQRKRDKTSLKDKLRNTYFTHSAGPAENKTDERLHYLFDRWMWFGSGFYGLAAIWTLTVVEVMDVLNFITTFPGFGALFENGVFALLVELLVNQVTNVFSAFAWFTYWTSDAIGTWILVAYLGYSAGMKLAKFQQK